MQVIMSNKAMKSFILLFLFGISFVGIGQNKTKKATKVVPTKVFTKSYGLITATNTSLLGGASFRITKTTNDLIFGKTSSHYFNAELVNFKNSKENSTQTSAGGRNTYGKLNYFFVFRPEYGREINLFKRNDSEGIGLNAIVAVGPSFGIQKPFYIIWDDGKQGGQKFSVPFNPVLYSDDSRIVGADAIYKGILESKIINGIHLKTALNFDISTFRENASGIEIGLNTEVFTRRPEIMAYSKSPSFYFAPYLTLYFGTKKSK